MVDPKIEFEALPEWLQSAWTEFEALPEWLQSAWKLAPEIARKAEAELSALRAERDTLRGRVAELEAQAATLTPRKCVTCQQAAEQMREAAASFADDFDGDNLGFDLPTSIGAGIRSLPLPCGDCNPLAPVSDKQQCGNCKHFSRCEKFIGAKAHWTQCDWEPSRFEKK